MNAALNEILSHEVFPNISRYIVQLYRIDDTEMDIYPLATGVLIELKGSCYLLTAAHVYHNEDVNKIGILQHNGDFLILDGDISFFSDDNSEQNIAGDIAVNKLSIATVIDLKTEYFFLPEERICLDYVMAEKDYYLMLGYPASKTKKICKRVHIKVTPFKFISQGVLESKLYYKLKLTKRTNYLIKFHRKKGRNFINNCKQMLPKPKGNSGMGLWLMNGINPLLIGIMTGFNHSETVFIGTRIDLATELIRYRFDSSVKKSNVISPSFVESLNCQSDL